MMEPTARDGFRPRADALAAAGAIVLLALALRAWDLERESFWLDELCSVADAHERWRSLVANLAQRDVHPPLYFALLKLWVAAFGASERAARSLSVLAGLAAVVSAGRLGACLGGRRAGLVAMALVACSPFCVYYSGEARAYSLLLALTLEATLRLVRATRDPRPAALARYALVAVMLPYTHVFGAFTLAAHGLAALAAWRAGRVSRRAAGHLALTLGLVGLAFAPWIPSLLSQVRRVERGFWVPRPNPAWHLAEWLRGGDAGIAWVLGVSVAAAVTLHRWRRARNPHAALLAAGVLVPTLVPIAISYASQPIFVAKYAIGAVGLLLVAAAPTLARSPAAVVALCLAGIVDAGRDVHLKQHREDWRGIARFARREAAAKGPALVMTAYLERQLAVYLGDVPVQVVEPTRAAQLPRRFWLLNVHPQRTDPRLAPALAEHWKAVERREFFQAEAILWEAQGPSTERVSDALPKRRRLVGRQG